MKIESSEYTRDIFDDVEIGEVVFNHSYLWGGTTKEINLLESILTQVSYKGFYDMEDFRNLLEFAPYLDKATLRDSISTNNNSFHTLLHEFKAALNKIREEKSNK